MTFDVFEKRYRDYAAEYRQPDGTLCEPMQRKLTHTMEVTGFAMRIAEHEGLKEEDAFLCRLSALFHDVARFEQVKLHHSFNDSACGFDHGHEGVRILYAREMLAGLAPEQQLAVAAAVEMHNKPSVDYTRISSLCTLPVKMTRDADKLSILRQLSDFASGKLEIQDKSVFLLGKADSEELTPAVLQAVLDGRVILHSELKTVHDFLVSLLGWCCDFQFAETAIIVRERGFYDQLLNALPESTSKTVLRQKTMERLQCLCSK